MKIFFPFAKMVLAILLIALPLSGAVGGWTLPEITGFIGGETTRTALEAPAGNYGDWLARTYVGPGGRSVKVTLMAGQGAGRLSVPPEGFRGDDRPLGFGSVYEGLTVEGRGALLEEVPTLGLALAIAVADQETLTLESQSLGRDELIRAAEELIRAMN